MIFSECTISDCCTNVMLAVESCEMTTMAWGRQSNHGDAQQRFPEGGQQCAEWDGALRNMGTVFAIGKSLVGEQRRNITCGEHGDSHCYGRWF